MNEPPAVWDYVAVSAYQTPTSPVSEAAQGTLASLWNRMRRLPSGGEPAAKRMAEPGHPEENVLDAATPRLDWTRAADALAARLELGRDASPPQHAQNRRVLIGPPGHDLSAILSEFTGHPSAASLTLPSSEQILSNQAPDDWQLLGECGEGETVVLPRLESCFLRHAAGLRLVRRLLERIVSSRGRVLVGCDSWAWAFLQRTVGVEDLLGEPLTIAPFDAHRLERWLRSCLPTERWSFRPVENDESILSEANSPADASQDDAGASVSSYLHSLAVWSRGNPAVAAAFWRAGLRTLPSETHDAPETRDAPDADSTSAAGTATLWVAAPSELTLPDWPEDRCRWDALITHAVLLHGGLSLASLRLVLPHAGAALLGRVNVLCRAGILVRVGERLQVALESYPKLRRHLISDGFLADEL